MASIEKRTGKRKVTWRVQLVIGTVRRTRSFRRRTDAVEWAVTTEKEMRDGHHVADRKERLRTVAELLAKYRTEILPAYDEKEQDQRGGKLDWWVARLGSRRLHELRPREIAECLDRLAAGETPSGKAAAAATQGQYLAVLRHALSKGVTKWEWIKDNPAKRVEAPKKPRGKDRFLSEEERASLLRACEANENWRLHPLVLLALSTGARQGELLALRWEDVDFARAQAVVDGKNGDKRALALSEPALLALLDVRQRQVQRIGRNLVFATDAGQATFPRKAWEAALRTARLDDFRFHDLRHTAASYLLMTGASLPELAGFLGHKTLAMVARYAHLTTAHTASVSQRMAEGFLLFGFDAAGLFSEFGRDAVLATWRGLPVEVRPATAKEFREILRSMGAMAS